MHDRTGIALSREAEAHYLGLANGPHGWVAHDDGEIKVVGFFLFPADRDRFPELASPEALAVVASGARRTPEGVRYGRIAAALAVAHREWPHLARSGRTADEWMAFAGLAPEAAGMRPGQRRKGAPDARRA